MYGEEQAEDLTKKLDKSVLLKGEAQQSGQQVLQFYADSADIFVLAMFDLKFASRVGRA